MDSYDELFLEAMNTEGTIQNHRKNGILHGKIISKEDNGFFVSVGGKSEMILPYSEVVDSVCIGDEIALVHNGSKDGISYVSQKKASQAKAYEKIHNSVDQNIYFKAIVTQLVTNKEGEKKGFLVSIDGVEAFLPMSHAKVIKNDTMIGKTITVIVMKAERNSIVVSEKIVRDRLQKEHFVQFVDKYKEGDKISVTVDDVTDSFALVIAENITMFLHITEFDWKYIKNMPDILKVGDQFDVIIKTIDLSKNSIKVSRKEAIQNPVELFFNNYQEGDTLSATVLHFKKHGVLLENADGVELFLPLGEISWVSKVSDPKYLLKKGDHIEIKILEMNEDNGNIIVSLRDLLENPWDNAHKKYARNTKHEGKVISITDFGIFIIFDDGIQGLIRIEDIEWNVNEIDLQARFKRNDILTAVVISIDTEKEKLRLGIKQLEKNPFQDFCDTHKVGSLISGKIENILKDSIDIEIPEGVKAFIHISQLSKDNVGDIHTLYKVGDIVEAVIRRINFSQQKIELSIRDLLHLEEKKEINKYMKNNELEIPTLGSMFGDILKKNK